MTKTEPTMSRKKLVLSLVLTVAAAAGLLLLETLMHGLGQHVATVVNG